MPNIGIVLRDEIQRLARKEIRATVGPLKKKVAELTRTNAALKRKVPALEKVVVRLEKEAEARMLKGVQAGARDVKGVRIGPRSISAQRKRLGLSRGDFGTLAGVSANSVYLWETGKVNPTEKSRAVLVGLRGLGAKEAKRLVEVEKAKAPKKKAAPRRRGKKKR